MRKFLLVIFFFSGGSSFAQGWQDTLQKIEKIFEPYKGVPGAQLAISRNGQVILSKAWGMADMEHDVPLTTASIIEAGSVSKQFTAASILLLEQQGKLSLEDDVRKYIPELPDYGVTIRLRHMMQHTSGLRDWGSVAALSGWPRYSKTYDNNDALQIVSRQKALNHVPGAEFIYSNSNYNLFAVIVERVSGLSLADFSRKFIFSPAGMKKTEWRDDFRRIVKNRAIAYDPMEKGYQADMPNEFVYGNGGLLTTAEELLQWNDYYLNGKLGSPSLLEKQLYSNPLNNGTKNSYAAGLFIQATNGWSDITHNGATAGYRADLHYFPDLKLSIAWLSNNSRPTTVVRDVINLFVPAKPETNTANAVATTVPAAILAGYAGWYRNERSGDGILLTAKEGALFYLDRKMIPVSNTNFLLSQNKVLFVPEGLRMITVSGDTVRWQRAPDPENDLQQYTGRYQSDETDSELDVVLKNGKLEAVIRPADAIPLTPTYKDGFNSSAGTIHFQRDQKNKIITMRISVSRARNVLFNKIN